MRLMLPHFLVYWPPMGANTFGRPLLGDPVQYACRWDDTMQAVIGSTGEETLSNSTAIFYEPAEVGGVVMLGKLDDLGSGFPVDPREDPRVREVVSRSRTSDLRGDRFKTQIYMK